MTSRSADELFGALNPPPPRVNGWWLFSWRQFEQQLETLISEVERLQRRDPDGYRSHPQTRLLAAIVRLVEVDIPRDPGHRGYRQGSTLGVAYTTWFRASFLRRFRLFYRYQTTTRAIVCAWVNTEGGLRKAGDKHDPYTVFRKILDRGQPPADFDALLQESTPLALPSSSDPAGSESPDSVDDTPHS